MEDTEYLAGGVNAALDLVRGRRGASNFDRRARRVPGLKAAPDRQHEARGCAT
jgi:hypothetical protein